ncbi:xanthine dehydrogenase family protein molybdopterin-binding subunit [Rhodobacteraceae bacterium NNCM2]|nr:xanthine dehydrogenase family protein molybdopterin-binding subunit [Coraliihabitans acroporae]
MKFGLGQSVPRLEDPRLLRGEGTYIDDISLPSQTHAAVLRSPVAHGVLRNVDVTAAREMPGVLVAWAGPDVAGRLTELSCDFPLQPPQIRVTMPHLATDRVRFVGQPIAIVVAETRFQAMDALESIDFEIDELDSVTDPEAALAPGAPLLHDAAPGNMGYEWEHGDAAAVEAEFARAAHVVSTPVLNQRLAIVAMEPRGINIKFEDGKWEAWVGTQGAHGMRAKIAKSLGVAEEQVRVHVPDVGGGFGMKLMDHPEYGLCALAAHELARPVKWIGERTESFLSDAQGRDVRGTVEGAFDADGICTAMRMRTISGLGAYYSTAGVAIHTVFSANLLGGMYKIKAHHAHVRGAFVNSVPTDAYRGAGRPEAIYFTERLMDAAARELGIDRAELRRRNLVTPDMLPHPTPGGMTFDSLDTHAVVASVAERAGWQGFDPGSDGQLRGIGIAYYMERTGGQPFERSRIRVTPEGGAEIFIGTQSTGQGHETAWAQVLHSQLGLPLDQIRLMAGDSEALPKGGGTGGSRSAKMASQVILLAADDIIGQGRKHAAEALEAAEEDIEFNAETASFQIAGTDRSLSLAAVAERAGELSGIGEVDETRTTFPNGCHVAEVAIDPETGKVTLERYTITDDFGNLINPNLVKGQIHGGVVQGIGQILCEEMCWDEGGQPQSASLMDYCMPRAGDLPPMDVDFVIAPSLNNPLGVKGCGEAGCAGGIAATGLAVIDALSRAGVTGLEAPYTPNRVWQALHEAGRA